MKGRYYTMNISSREQEKKDKRRQILRKRIKGACVTAQILSLLFMLGIIGGLENNTMSIGQFIFYSMITIGILWVSFAVNNEIENRE